MVKAVVSVMAYGLGNQLYQYAAGLALARRLGCAHRLDLDWYADTPPGTEPRAFTLPGLIGEEGLARARRGAARRLADRLAGRLSGRPHRHGVPVWSTGNGYGEDFFAIPAPRCILGVPGHYPFFEALEEELSRRILASAPAERARARFPGLAARAFVHVRRGDLVSSEKVSGIMRCIGPDYYAEAMRRYEARHGPTDFLVFSDDIAAARDCIGPGFAAEFAGTGDELEDFAAMAQCAGGVAANSSFSWWAGFVGRARKETVVIPGEWGKVAGRTPELPPEWVAL